MGSSIYIVMWCEREKKEFIGWKNNLEFLNNFQWQVLKKVQSLLFS